MKKLSFTFLFVFLTILIVAQIPQAFKYQTVVRDATGEILSNKFISLQITIHDGTTGGTIVYQETHDVTTNQFGLVNLEIGTETPVIGSFPSIDWGSGLKYLEVALDPNGGSIYISMGTSQILSVPFALHAESSGHDGDWTIDGIDLYTTLPGKVGIGTSTPGNGKLDVIGNGNTGIFTSSAASNGLHAESSAGGGFAAGYFNAANPGTYGIWTQSSDYEAIFATTLSSTFPAIRANGEIAGVFDGKVGIGTTNPVYELDVSGIINSENPYHINGNKVLSIDGSENILVGKGAGGNNTGERVTLVGDSAGYHNQAYYNTFIGNQSGYSNTTGIYNTFLGTESGYLNTTGDRNTFIGHLAGLANTTGESNVSVGEFAGHLAEGNYGTYIGSTAGFSSDGDYNTFIGYMAGYNNSAGSGNVFIGSEAGYNELGSNKLIIANGASDNNVLIYGNFTTGHIGLGTTNPTQKLTINGGDALIVGSDGWAATGHKAKLFLGDPNHGMMASHSEGLRIYTYNNPSHDIRFQNHTGTDYMTIKMGSGNVGIGTSDPEFKFSLNDDGGILAEGESGTGQVLAPSGVPTRTRLIWYPRKAAFRVGHAWFDCWDDINIGWGSVAMGNGNFARGSQSTALGYGTEANGDMSIAVGQLSIASDLASAAIGDQTKALASGAIALGRQTEAKGFASTAMGQSTVTDACFSTSIGYNNLGGGDTWSWIDSDPLFEVGNGYTNEIPSNALTILKNGRVGIGTHNPSRLLHIYSTTNPRILVESTSSQAPELNLRRGTTTHSLYVNGNNDLVFYQAGDRIWFTDNGMVGIGTTPTQKLTVYNGSTTGTYETSGWQHSSDARLKTNISIINSALVKVINMEGVYFNWKNNDEKRQVGLIAQDVLTILPETVSQNNDGYYSISYGGIVPVLIEAVKEQQEIIEELKKRIEKLEKK